MRLLAGLASGVFAAGLVAVVLGWGSGSRLFRRRPGRISLWLNQAGASSSPGQFLVASAMASLAAFVLAVSLTGVPALALALGVVVGLSPGYFYGRQRTRRMSEVQQALPDALRGLVASISSGMSLVRSIEHLSATGPPAIKQAFEPFPRLWRTHGVVPALEAIKEDLAHPASDRVIEVLILAHERGGETVPLILRDLADAASKDVWLMEEIHTQSLEQRINARAVFALPWLVLVAITLREGAFRDFYATSAGMLVVAAGAVMSGVGIALVSRLGRHPGEPRVFGR